MIAALLALFLVVPGFAADNEDYIDKPGTTRVAQSDGDTPGFYQVSLTTSAWTEIRPAVTDKSRRLLVVQNRSTVQTVEISTHTGSVGSVGAWVLGESTNSATVPIWETRSSAQYYGRAATTTGEGTAVTAILRVEERKQTVSE